MDAAIAALGSSLLNFLIVSTSHPVLAYTPIPIVVKLFICIDFPLEQVFLKNLLHFLF